MTQPITVHLSRQYPARLARGYHDLPVFEPDSIIRGIASAESPLPCAPLPGSEWSCREGCSGLSWPPSGVQAAPGDMQAFAIHYRMGDMRMAQIVKLGIHHNPGARVICGFEPMAPRDGAVEHIAQYLMAAVCAA